VCGGSATPRAPPLGVHCMEARDSLWVRGTHLVVVFAVILKHSTHRRAVRDVLCCRLFQPPQRSGASSQVEGYQELTN